MVPYLLGAKVALPSMYSKEVVFEIIAILQVLSYTIDIGKHSRIGNKFEIYYVRRHSRWDVQVGSPNLTNGNGSCKIQSRSVEKGPDFP
jgi:hypothetical protein